MMMTMAMIVERLVLLLLLLMMMAVGMVLLLMMSQGRGRGSRAAEKVRWNGNYLRLLILMRRNNQRNDHFSEDYADAKTKARSFQA